MACLAVSFARVSGADVSVSSAARGAFGAARAGGRDPPGFRGRVPAARRGGRGQDRD